MDASLSCRSFRDTEWVRTNRPEWPPNLRERLARYVSEVPQPQIVMPPKGAPPSKGELVF